MARQTMTLVRVISKNSYLLAFAIEVDMRATLLAIG